MMEATNSKSSLPKPVSCPSHKVLLDLYIVSTRQENNVCTAAIHVTTHLCIFDNI